MQKIYLLENLDCANCAMKIEKHIGKMNGIKEVSVDFVSRKMFLEIEQEVTTESIVKIVGDMEPEVNVIELTRNVKQQDNHNQEDHAQHNHEEEHHHHEKGCCCEHEHEKDCCGHTHEEHHHDHEHGCCCGDDHEQHEERVIQGATKLYINGLDCANCAAKIEAYVAKMDNVQDASLNFSNGILFVELKNNKEKDKTLNEIMNIIPTLEDRVQVEFEKQEEEQQEHKLEAFSLKNSWKLYVGMVLFVFGIIFEQESYAIWIFIVAYIFAGGRVVLTALKNIMRGEVFDENFLMSVATIGAFCVQSYEEAVAVMIFYEVGEMFQSYAVNRSRKSISSLMNIRADYATVFVDGKEEQKDPEAVNVNDTILVKPGERVPLDGILLEGSSSLDTSALTGESLPKDITLNDEVLAGSVNLSGVITMRVTKEYGESTVSRILELVENASSKKAPMEKFITKFARIYTPVVVGLAVALVVLPMLFVPNAQFHDWLYRALTFLVVSCPCALVVSIPLGLFAGIGSAGRQGILIKGGNYLEALKDIDTVVFDKTGTLTKGVFKVVDIYSEHKEKDVLLEIAAYGEYYSSHPIALSIKRAYGKEIDTSKLSNYKEVAGNGIHVQYNKDTLLLGNYKLMDANHISYAAPQALGTVIYVAINQTYAGCIVIDDEIKETSQKAISGLKAAGMKTVMLSGDRKEVGEHVANVLGLDEVHMQLLPADKVDIVEDLLSKEKDGHKLAFVGDGMNDAPVLARADIGVAMGGIGSDAAIEAADVVLMKDDPLALNKAILIARKTMHILWQNIVFSLGIKIVILILTAFGMANMWMGVFADVGVTLLAVLNSMRALKS